MHFSWLQLISIVRAPLVFALVCCSGIASAEVEHPKEMARFFENHCYDCHDDESTKGDFDLTALPFSLDKPHHFEQWQEVFDRVASGEMPPKKKKQPTAKELAPFLSALEGPLTKADRKLEEALGRVRGRRLTLTEYTNTIHDLLGVDIPFDELFPKEQVSHGFETVVEAQQLSHFLVQNYLDGADLALQEALGRLLEGDETYKKFHPPKLLTKKGGGNYRGPEPRDGQIIAWPMRVQFYGRMFPTRVPKTGWYRVTLKGLHAVNPKNGVVWGTLKSGACSSNQPLLYEIGLIEATAQKRDLVYDAWIRKDHALELKPNDATLKLAPNAGKGGNVSYQGKDHRKAGISGIALSGIEIERIYPNANRAQIADKLLGKGVLQKFQKADKAGQVVIINQAIRRFSSRAFRRPVTDKQVAPYLELAKESLKEPDIKKIEVLRIVYRAILCSPRFLTFVEPVGKLDDHAIASRLSYMLWNTMPDNVLRYLADSGRLRRRDVLVRQVNRMLDDPRGQRFVNSFTDQWLNLRDINFTTPDQRMFRQFDGIVKTSMVDETRAYFNELLKQDLPIYHVVHSDFSMLNERLARHYGMTKVSFKPGGGIQRTNTKNFGRGGFLTQGSVLKITANGTKTSPVVRGVWVAERILGLHVPPPPPNVPAVEPDIRGAVSIRDQLAKHSKSDSCAGCHRKIDPAGFALENFDPVGVWRTKYGKSKNAATVNPAGVTPEGEPFKGLAEWKSIYAKQPDLLAKAFTKNLATYATGASPTFSDRKEIETIAKSTRGKKYGVRSLVHALVASEIFLSK